MKLQKMWLHQHPFELFLPKEATHLIVGTLPPPRFFYGDLKSGYVPFCYGSIDGQFWPILDRIYSLDLRFENSAAAVQERKTFLTQINMGICDIVAHCYRKKWDASDMGMQEVQLHDFFSYLDQVPKVQTLLFTGGDNKNGLTYFFKRYLKSRGLSLALENDAVPRQHSFTYNKRRLTTYSLTAPSGAANRAVGSMAAYKAQKAKDPSFTTLDFRVQQYQKVFPQII